MKQADNGFTLLEVLIAAVLLTLIAIPIFSLLWTSKHGIDRTDRNREIRFLTDMVMNCAENADFVELWKNFGGDFDGLGCPVGPSQIRSGLGENRNNPLRIDVWVFERLKANKWPPKLQFRLLTKKELKHDPKNPMTGSGVLHLQAGVIVLQIKGDFVNEEIRKVVYCPMILGRPGLDLNQCPAVNPAIRDGLLKDYP